MAPVEGEAAAAATARRSSAVAGASSHGAEEPEARAPLRWPFTSRRQQERAQQRRAAADESPSSSESEEASVDGRGQSPLARGREESELSDSDSASVGSPGAGSERPVQVEEQASNEADAAVPHITSAALAARCSEMFVIGESWPKAVRMPLLAKSVTKRLVKFAIEVVKKLCERDGKALSRSFGNFDQRVALGWLLADARGWPLLTKEHALACGTKAQREGGYIKDAIKTARKDALAAARAAGSDPRAAQDEAEAKLLTEAAGDIALPDLPAAVAPASKPGRAATGARKRKRETEPTELDALEHRLDTAESNRKLARKALQKAESALEAAKKAEGRKLRVANTVLGNIKQLPQKATSRFAKLYGVFRRADQEWQHARLAARDAEIALLHAHIDWQDAYIDSAETSLEIEVACNAALAD